MTNSLWPTYKPAEYEPKTLEQKLYYLIEECSEVQKAACKILRFGGDSYAPKSAWNNWNLLRDELGDIQLAVRIIRDHIND